MKKKNNRLLPKLTFCANYNTRTLYSTTIDLSTRRIWKYTSSWSTVKAVICNKLYDVVSNKANQLMKNLFGKFWHKLSVDFIIAIDEQIQIKLTEELKTMTQLGSKDHRKFYIAT